MTPHEALLRRVESVAVPARLWKALAVRAVFLIVFLAAARWAWPRAHSELSFQFARLTLPDASRTPLLKAALVARYAPADEPSDSELFVDRSLGKPSGLAWVENEGRVPGRMSSRDDRTWRFATADFEASPAVTGLAEPLSIVTDVDGSILFTTQITLWDRYMLCEGKTVRLITAVLRAQEDHTEVLALFGSAESRPWHRWRASPEGPPRLTVYVPAPNSPTVPTIVGELGFQSTSALAEPDGGWNHAVCLWRATAVDPHRIPKTQPLVPALRRVTQSVFQSAAAPRRQD